MAEQDGAPAATFYPAMRCGECHEKMYDEWRQSAHRQSDQSKLYQAMSAKSGSKECVGCHAPLTGRLAKDELAAKDGVGCETCHRIHEVSVSEDRSRFSLREEHDIKFGPLCETNAPYFHRTECRPFFEKADLCAGCHQWQMKTASGAKVPVYTEYADWKAGPMNQRPCQSCHMPGEKAEVAVSEPEREDVPNHSFLGNDGSLEGTGIRASARIVAAGEKVRAVVKITNAKAGHFLPAGLSGRQLVLRVITEDDDGKSSKEHEHVFQRRLVDASGAEVPFFLATRVDGDTRLGPKQSKEIRVEADTKGSGRFRFELVRRSIAPAIAKTLGTQAEERVVLSAAADFGKAEPRGREHLPQTVELRAADPD